MRLRFLSNAAAWSGAVDVVDVVDAVFEARAVRMSLLPEVRRAVMASVARNTTRSDVQR